MLKWILYKNLGIPEFILEAYAAGMKANGNPVLLIFSLNEHPTG